MATICQLHRHTQTLPPAGLPPMPLKAWRSLQPGAWKPVLPVLFFAGSRSTAGWGPRLLPDIMRQGCRHREVKEGRAHGRVQRREQKVSQNLAALADPEGTIKHQINGLISLYNG